MDTTPNLNLPYIAAAQAQKHVTHNEAILALDAIVQIAVVDRDLATPPSSPDEGDRYIVAATATGAWAGQETNIAAWQDGAWAFYAPGEGWLAWIADENVLLAFDGSAWVGAAAALPDTLTIKDVRLKSAMGSPTPNLGVQTLAANSASRVYIVPKGTVSGSGAARAALKLFGTDFDADQTNYNDFGLFLTDLYNQINSKKGGTGTALPFVFSINDTTYLVYIGTDGKVGIGTVAPTSLLTVSANAAALPSPPLAATMLHLAAADAAGTSFCMDGFAGAPSMFSRRANGTNASKSALANNDAIFAFGAAGHDGSAYSGTRGRFGFNAAENWSSGHHGTYFTVSTTPVGATAVVEALRVTEAGNIRAGSDGTAACKLDVDGPVRVKGYTVAGVPSAAAGAGQIIYVSNESGGAVLAFSDGTNWRRVTDRAVIS